MSTPQEKKAPRPEVSIRRAKVEDAGDISRVIFESFGAVRERYSDGGFADVTPNEEKVAGRFAEGALWAAEIDGDIVGTVSLPPDPEDGVSPDRATGLRCLLAAIALPGQQPTSIAAGVPRTR